MKVKGIGINLDGDYLGGRLGNLERLLDTAAQLGYDHAEISGYGVGAVINGRLHRQRVAQVREVTSRFPLSYTVHGPCELNLCLGQPNGVEEQALGAYLEFCAEIESSVFVYHSGLINLHEPYWGLSGLPSNAEMEARREREVKALQRLGERAAALGVTIAMENRDPHLWEVAALARHGLGVEALPIYHAGLRIGAVMEQLARVDNSHIGMTLDLGHAHIAARTCDWDFGEMVREAAPHIRHIHMHDNVGKLDGFSDSQGERQPLGQGDLHMPPGWGAIPFDEVWAHLPDYDGVVMLEIRPRYHDHLAEALASTREILQRSGKF